MFMSSSTVFVCKAHPGPENGFKMYLSGRLRRSRKAGKRANHALEIVKRQRNPVRVRICLDKRPRDTVPVGPGKLHWGFFSLTVFLSDSNVAGKSGAVDMTGERLFKKAF
jgi:hypothetical protein